VCDDYSSFILCELNQAHHLNFSVTACAFTLTERNLSNNNNNNNLICIAPACRMTSVGLLVECYGPFVRGKTYFFCSEETTCRKRKIVHFKLITAARSGVCRYGRLLYSAHVFFFFLFNESP